MKKILFLCVLMVSASILSCEKEKIESNTPSEEDLAEQELQAKLKANRYVMKKYYEDLYPYYFWYFDTKSKTDKLNYESFTSVSQYFEATLHSVDHWSWMADGDYYRNSESGIKEKTWGISLKQPIDYYNDYSVRISIIYPDSPFAKYGVTRGWKLTHLGGEKVNTLIADNKFTRELNKSPQEFTFVDLNDSVHVITESSLDDMIANPCLISKVFSDSDYPGLTGKVGYFNYLSFLNSFNGTLDSIMASFNEQGVNEMILDLRYNGGGDERSLNLLAGYLAPKSADGQVLKKTIHNSRLQIHDSCDTLKVNAKTLDLKRLFVIMSDNTASSSECIINGLSPFMDVYKVGRQSYGKPNGMYVLLYPSTDADYARYNRGDYSKLMYVFLPIAFFNKNSRDESIPYDGYIPDNDRPDDLYHDFDVNEDNIRACLEKIVNDTFPDLPKTLVQMRSYSAASDMYRLPDNKTPLYGSTILPLPDELRRKFNE